MNIKFALILLAFCFSNVTFAQIDEDLTTFSLMLNFKFKDEPAYGITITQMQDNTRIIFQNTSCQAMQDKQDISDKYIYNQLVDYISQIDLANFSPPKSDQGGNTDLQIECRFRDDSDNEMNYFHYLYNPFTLGEENQLLEYFIEVIENNITRSCHWEILDKLKKHME